MRRKISHKRLKKGGQNNDTIDTNSMDISGIQGDEDHDLDMSGIQGDEDHDLDMSGIQGDEDHDLDMSGIHGDENHDLDNSFESQGTLNLDDLEMEDNQGNPQLQESSINTTRDNLSLSNISGTTSFMNDRNINESDMDSLHLSDLNNSGISSTNTTQENISFGGKTKKNRKHKNKNKRSKKTKKSLKTKKMLKNKKSKKTNKNKTKKMRGGQDIKPQPGSLRLYKDENPQF
jgi:hypothetical protein